MNVKTQNSMRRLGWVIETCTGRRARFLYLP